MNDYEWEEIVKLRALLKESYEVLGKVVSAPFNSEIIKAIEEAEALREKLKDILM